MATKSRRKSQLQKFRTDVARLKELGLVSKRVDAKRQKATKYMQGQVEQFRDVLTGKAKAVAAPDRKTAKKFSDKFRVKGSKVVIPAGKQERIRYSKTTDEFVASYTTGRKRVTKHYSANRFEDIIKLPQGDNILYRIPLGNHSFTFDNEADLIAFMHPYETNPRNPYKNWQRYLEIITIDDLEGDEA